MKTVVITGSSRGLGFEMAKVFRKNGQNVVLSATNSKRAITYFTEALAREAEVLDTGVLVGKLSPGIMITDFLTNAFSGKEKIELDEKTKKIYNILGDRPDAVAEFLVNTMLKNKKNKVKIEWLTNRKAAWRFMTAGFNKRDFFS